MSRYRPKSLMKPRTTNKEGTPTGKLIGPTEHKCEDVLVHLAKERTKNPDEPYDFSSKED